MGKKRVIWSLFDSETAITQKLNNNQYEVYSIGLPSSSAITDNFIKMNLKKKKIKSEHHISISKKQVDKVRKSNIWQEQGFSSPTAYLIANLKMKDTYCDRSRVPLELYQHVLRIYENKEQLSLF